MKLPTDKQINLAQRISYRLGISLPQERTRQAYFLYIRDNLNDYLLTTAPGTDDDAAEAFDGFQY